MEHDIKVYDNNMLFVCYTVSGFKIIFIGFPFGRVLIKCPASAVDGKMEFFNLRYVPYDDFYFNFSIV